MMQEISLNAKTRDTGKKGAKATRNEGYVTGVYYIKGEENISIKVKPIDLRPIVYTNITKIVQLNVEGHAEPYQCLLKSISFDPVTEAIVHFDLLGLKKGQKITVDLPIKLVGQAVGVRLGGKLMHTLHKVKVHSLPSDLVEAFEVDVTKLNMGDSIMLSDIDFGNMEIDLPLDTNIVQVARPRGGAATTTGTEAETAV
jgi:large subunit ribosomal protein L25